MMKAIPGNKPLLRFGLVSLGCGLVLLAAVSAMNRRATWLPLAADLPLVGGESVRFEFTPSRNGYYELQIEADDTMGEANRLRYLTDFENPSELDVDWVVNRGGEVVAAGDSTDFVFIERGPGSRLGRLRRVLLRIPYCQNATQWLSLGLAGSATSSRGIGRFEAVAGSDYAIVLTPASNYPVLTSSGVTFVVRPDRRLWLAHFGWAGPLAYASLFALALGGVLVVLGEFQRRFRGVGSRQGR